MTLLHGYRPVNELPAERARGPRLHRSMLPEQHT